MGIRNLKTASLVLLATVALIAMGATGYYFGRVKPLIKAGKQQGIYPSVPDRPAAAGFEFESENGARYSIAAFKGKVVVIDVWATWCGTCLYTIPEIAALQTKYQDRAVEVIGLNVDDEGWAKVTPFRQKHPEINYRLAVPFPAPSFLMKSIVDLKPLGDVSAIPTVFVVDREGRLAGKFIETGHEQQIDELVATLLKE